LSRNSINRLLMTGVVLSLALAGCSTRSVPTVSGSDAEATHRYSRALDYMGAGDDARATAELETLRDHYPEFSGPNVNLGIIHERNGRPDAAMAAFERAIEVCSACAVAHNQLGIAQREQGRFADAERSYQRAIDADPNYALAYYNLGILHDLYNRQPKLAVRYYRHYVDRETNPEDQKRVEKWIIDLTRRIENAGRSAQAGS
jgi:Tfp pilus assembly protein PilF